MRSASVSIAGASHINLAENALYIDVFSDPKHVYTAGDLVHGKVRVDPTARPQNVSIVFKGIAILYDKDLEACRTEFFRLEQELFTSTGTGENYDILRQGTAEDGRVELPFQFTFPQVAVQAPPPGRQWHYSKDSYGHPRFQHSPGFPLPPTCTTLMSADVPVPPGVSYYLEARADSTLRIRQQVLFTPPAPEYDLHLLQPNLDFGTALPAQHCRYKFIRTRKLLSTATSPRPTKLSRVKDFLVEKELFFGLETFSEIPFYRFNVLATPPRVLVLGSSFPLPLSLHHLDRSASIASPPPLFLRRIRIQLLSTFSTFVPPPLASINRGAEHTDRAQRSITLLDKRFSRGSGEPLTDGLDIASFAELSLAADDARLCPSFSAYGLSLEHELQVEVWGECVGNEWSGLVGRDKVQVVSAWTMGNAGGLGVGVHGVGRPPQAFPPPEYETV